MIKTKLLSYAVCAIFLVAFSVFAQREKSALLPSSEAKYVTEQCSRPSPDKFSDTWQPSKEEIKEMEAAFSQIKKLKARNCCMTGEQIENPEDFYMQYVGIVIDGKKLIYINAFPEDSTMKYTQNDDSTFSLTKSEDWKKSAVGVCDGGSSYWGVLYDPKAKRFFDLAVNGSA